MPESPDKKGHKSVSLDEIIALNDEIISLVRAGVPLEMGLKEIGKEHPGHLGALSSHLAERMGRGESLPQALDAMGDKFPKVYRTLVEAGLKAGRLPVALEALSGFAWELVDLRRRIGLALLYPLIVSTMAYGLFLVLLLEFAARINDTLLDFQIPVTGATAFLAWAGETAPYWAWFPPLVLVFLIGRWIIGGTSNQLSPQMAAGPFWWVFGVRRICHNYRVANFSGLLALLLEHEVPLNQAVVLAADATVDQKMQEAARTFSEANAQGESIGDALPRSAGFPPFLSWLMQRGERTQNLVESLQVASDMYRRRARNQSDWLKLGYVILPGVVIGAGVTLFYGLALFLPLIQMLEALT